MKQEVINKDCIQGLSKLEDKSVDLIVTDPMYNISSEKKIQRSKFYNPKYKRPSNIDFNFFGDKDKLPLIEFLSFTEEWLIEAYRILKDNGSIYCFFPRSEISFLEKIMEKVGFKVRSTCVWHKNNPIPNQLNISFSSAAEFFTFATRQKGKKHTFNSGRGLQNVFKYPLCQGKERTEHPTQKPLKLIRQLIQISSNEGDIVCDPFVGSGTTAVACRQLNRNCISFEINPEYCKIAEKRLSQKSVSGFNFSEKKKSLISDKRESADSQNSKPNGFELSRENPSDFPARAFANAKVVYH